MWSNINGLFRKGQIKGGLTMRINLSTNVIAGLLILALAVFFVIKLKGGVTHENRND